MDVGGASSPRYWTARARVFHDSIRAQLAPMAGDRRAALRALREVALEAVQAREPEGVCAAMRVAEAWEAGAELRFATAILAMEAGAYECACAAWEDGGGTWEDEDEDEEVERTPGSARAVAVLLGACEALAARTPAGVDEHRRLCAQFSRAGI